MLIEDFRRRCLRADVSCSSSIVDDRLVVTVNGGKIVCVKWCRERERIGMVIEG